MPARGRRRPVREAVEAVLGRAFFAIVGVAPYALCRVAARFFAEVGFRFFPAYRRPALANLRYVYGDELDARGRARIVRESFVNFALTVYELAQVRRMLRRGFGRVVTRIEGREHVEAARASGRGIIFASAHYGNWEYLGWCAMNLGCPIDLVVAPIGLERFDALFNRLRERTGVGVIGRRGALKEILSSLKAGRAVGVLMDQNGRGHGELLTFMGKPASTVTTVPAVARRCNAVVLAALLERIGPREFALTVCPPLEPSETGDVAADNRADAQRINDRLAERIRRRPGQWLWSHRRWRIKKDWFGEQEARDPEELSP